MKINILKSTIGFVIGFVAWKTFNMMAEAFNVAWVHMLYILISLIVIFLLLPGGTMALRTRYGIIILAMIVATIIVIFGGA